MNTKPSFYNKDNAAKWSYQANQRELLLEAQDWRSDKGIKSSSSDRRRVELLLIDMQRDFSFPEGSLFVGGRSGTGAIDDSRRTAEFIYRNISVISQVTTTLDTHFAFQIFSPSFWLLENGKHPDPFTFIVLKEEHKKPFMGDSVLVVEKGEVRVNPAVTELATGNKNAYTWLCEYAKHYCLELERKGKYQLYLWPEHCILGSDGHSLSGIIHEARLFHSFVRGSQSTSKIKGGNPLTENYSVFSPEVTSRHDGGAISMRSADTIKMLQQNDYVVIAGQAASHCVASSIDDLLEDINKEDPELAKKVYIMEDCMSAVTVPDGKGGFLADFTDNAMDALERYKNAGMHIVKSTDDISSWDDFIL